MRKRRDGLTLGDLEALSLYEALRYQVVQDLRLVPLVFDVFGLTMTRDDARLLLARLDVIHQDAAQAGQEDKADPPEGE